MKVHRFAQNVTESRAYLDELAQRSFPHARAHLRARSKDRVGGVNGVFDQPVLSLVSAVGQAGRDACLHGGDEGVRVLLERAHVGCGGRRRSFRSGHCGATRIKKRVGEIQNLRFRFSHPCPSTCLDWPLQETRNCALEARIGIFSALEGTNL